MIGAGGAAGWVGGAMQTIASLLERRAMEDAFRRASERAGQYATQAMGEWGAGLGKYSKGTFESDLAKGAATREGQYKMIGAVPLSIVPTSTRTAARDTAYANLLGKSRANLGGYGDALFNRDLYTQGTARNLGRIVNFAGGEAALTPYEMYKAQHSQDTLRAIGSFISNLGMGDPLSSSGGGGTDMGGGSIPAMGAMKGVQNWNQITPYWQQYANYWSNYYNNPSSRGYIAPGTYE